EDIINRVKYDIFYIENWSVLLDIKIIFITVFNTLRGDKKAY
ncbi:MAG: sugar transferase, partial [Flavobacterium sp.]|nr:sugar transferase [Flavobacterium sp.]